MSGFIDKQDRRAVRSDGLWIAKWMAVAVVAIFILVAVLNFAGLIFKGAYLDRENEVRRNSFQYEQTQRSFITQKISAYTELEADVAELQAIDADPAVIAAKQSQMKAFLREIRERASLIDPDDVPDDVQAFLLQHQND